MVVKNNVSVSRSAAVKSASVSKSEQVQLSRVMNADSGLKAKVVGDKLVIKGTAVGVQTRDPYAPDGGVNEPEYDKIEEFGGSIGLDFDRDRMPKFDTSNGFTAKNKWYFAHSISIGTKKGQTALQVAKALAQKVEGYDVNIKSKGDVATLQLIRR
jgi:hypothetical protein